MKPFQRAYYPEELLDPERMMRDFGCDRAQAEEVIRGMRECTVWKNDEYEVAMRRQPSQTGDPDLVHLSIKRLDKEPIHDWRKLQEIKNMLVGPECEGVELYPAESRLVDSANQFHLWVVDDARFRFGFGFGERMVTSTPGGNAKQRPR